MDVGPDIPASRRRSRPVVTPKGGALQGLDAFAALNQVVEAARDCIKTHEEQAAIRARIGAYEATEVARIKAGEAVLKEYFAQVVAELRNQYEELFSRLDQALEEGNGEVLHSLVRGIVDIARSSPLADLGDLSTGAGRPRLPRPGVGPLARWRPGRGGKGSSLSL